MEIIDNINSLFGDNLKQTITPGSKLKIAAKTNRKDIRLIMQRNMGNPSSV